MLTSKIRKIFACLESLDHDKSVHSNLWGRQNGKVKALWHVDNIQASTRCAGWSVYCFGPLAAAILSSYCDMEPKHSYNLGGGEE